MNTLFERTKQITIKILTSKILKASLADKRKALNVLNEVKDKPLLVSKMEAINELFKKAEVIQSPNA